MNTTRTLIRLALAGALSLPLLGLAKPPPPMPQQPMRPMTRCMDLTRINDWHVIDDHTMTVANGPRYFLIKTRYACPRLGHQGGGLMFRPSEDKRAIDLPRICGDVGDEVASRDQPPCAIASVKPISKAEYQRLSAHARRDGSGARQMQPVPPHDH
ncbi:DUF6491 family protein [Oleiagrimonas sp. C23AA]|uniref:DUF6491 family protein n=1 Tax=Oleiagrimonas sp. C23AA TaxID=2719047 RepID=UPI00142372BB|nr:DUF6491 family protein [Oleiagrimonas sp. C23AA]NII09075.1 hypothetical protein [Oleiagrimonas sp. C23AA]